MKGAQVGLDPVVSLAVALRTDPGSYAILLGAGISIPSGAPSAWQVQDILIRRVAAVEGVVPEDSFGWYETRFGEPPTYSALLSALTTSAEERQALLKEFFEPSASELTTESMAAPTAAHHAIADLVAGGYVRLIITTNFDRLMEAALRARGIEPLVISTPSSLAGMMPLRAIKCLVLHVHGDYLNPSGMLNTSDELSGYPNELNDRLDQVFDEYGLIIAGWSAEHDHALRQAFERCATRRYRTVWVEPGFLGEKAEDLRVLRSAELVEETADQFFPRLRDAVKTLEEASGRHPLTVQAAVSKSKRELASGGVAVGLHDMLRFEVERLAEADVLTSETYDDDSKFRPRLADLLARADLLLPLIATTVYWGDDGMDRWWFNDLGPMAAGKNASGSAGLINLSRAPGVLIFTTAGIAAVAAERWPLVAQLFSEPRVENRYKNNDFPPLAAYLGPDVVFPRAHSASRSMWELMRPIFVEQLGLGGSAFEYAWERFEYLRVLNALDMSAQGITTTYEAGRIHHLKAEEDGFGYRPVVSRWAKNARNQMPLLQGGLFGGSAERLEKAITRHGERFTSQTQDIATKRLPQGGGFMPSGPWYPDESVPER